MQKTLIKVIHRLCKGWIERHWNIWKRSWSRRCYPISFI